MTARTTIDAMHEALPAPADQIFEASVTISLCSRDRVALSNSLEGLFDYLADNVGNGSWEPLPGVAICGEGTTPLTPVPEADLADAAECLKGPDDEDEEEEQNPRI